jgi:3-hydroxyisobutyrate dehydrogenase-like beta-hydroxyacid dehydrogenase
MTKVTIIGLGNMGATLAASLLDAGHDITVWNRTPAKAEALRQRGAAVAPTAAEAIGASGLVVLCVLNYASVRELLADGGALDGRVIVNLTSGTPAEARSLGPWIDARGARYVDGGIMAIPPMIGSRDALVLYSGSRAAFGASRETLEAFGTAKYLDIDPGLAALYDLALLAGMYGLFGGALHAFALARSGHATAEAFLPLLQSWLAAMAQTLPEMARQIDTGRHVQPGGSAIGMQAAAIGSIATASREQRVDPVFIEPMIDLMQRHVANGRGEDDISGLIEIIARRKMV